MEATGHAKIHLVLRARGGDHHILQRLVEAVRCGNALERAVQPGPQVRAGAACDNSPGEAAEEFLQPGPLAFQRELRGRILGPRPRHRGLELAVERGPRPGAREPQRARISRVPSLRHHDLARKGRPAPVLVAGAKDDDLVGIRQGRRPSGIGTSRVPSLRHHDLARKGRPAPVLVAGVEDDDLLGIRVLGAAAEQGVCHSSSRAAV